MNLPKEFQPSIGGSFAYITDNGNTCVRVYSKRHEGKTPMCLTALASDIEEAEALAKKWSITLNIPAHYCAPGVQPRKLKS